MFVLEPVFHKTIWGGNRLVNVYGQQASGLGHLYSLRCKDGDSNVILNGKFAGCRLFDVIGPYPLSIALVDAALDLSIQVHPGGGAAKYESYFFIDAPKSGYIYCGIDNISNKEVGAAAENGLVMSHIGKTAVQNGDYIFVEPRTVHALTAGSFVYEIEQGEDNTYRLFDYNRTDAEGKRRELQIEQAISALDASLKAKTCKYQLNTAISEETYVTKLLTNLAAYSNNESGYECLTLLAGSAAVDGVPLKTGMSVLIEPGEKIERLAIEQCIAARPLI